MNSYFGRFFLCLLFALPSWLAGAIQNMANGGDLLVTAGFAAALAWTLGLKGTERRKHVAKTVEIDISRS